MSPDVLDRPEPLFRVSPRARKRLIPLHAALTRMQRLGIEATSSVESFRLLVRPAKSALTISDELSPSLKFWETFGEDWVEQQEIPSDVADLRAEDSALPQEVRDAVVARRDVVACLNAIWKIWALMLKEAKAGRAPHVKALFWELRRILTHMSDHLEYNILWQEKR